MSDPVIPNIPKSLPADQARFFKGLKSSIEYLLGHGRNREADRAVRVSELSDVQDDVSAITSSIGDLSSGAPDPPTDLTVTKSVFVNTLSWTNPEDERVSYIEVWVAEASQDRGNAWLEGIVTVTSSLRGEAGSYKHSGFDITEDHTYWIRSVSFADNHSVWCPPDAQGGYVVTGSSSVQEAVDTLLDTLTGEITQSQLYQDLSDTIDQIAANETSIANETTARQSGDSALASSISTVQSTVNGHTASIQTNASSIDGIEGKYSVKVDNNGYVTGFGLISTSNSGTPTSEFIILVDNFKIVTPGDNPTVPFAVGEIDGDSTVGINGNLVLDGTMLAPAIAADQITVDHLDTSEVFVGLSIQSSNYSTGSTGWKIDKNGNVEINGGSISISSGSGIANFSDAGALATRSSPLPGSVGVSHCNATIIAGGAIATGLVTAQSVSTNQIITSAANIQDAVITGAKIRDLEVDTLQIADDAVSVPVSAFSATGDDVSVTVNGVAAGQAILLTCSMVHPDSAGLYLSQNGTTIWGGIPAGPGLSAHNRVVTPGAGNWTYRWWTTSTGLGCSSASITAYLVKK